ncbi:uncharacterized membrane protein YoaK (UPF0700 family) [Pseudoxanthomonas japonensis]|uniref:YoaK family protein n=1 Tax=Pseudoxanthomonas japonensis TaxID=69284 RepID=UPI0028665B8E|nr:YoaK family protein [Pseudoxanthomonas japonensis]MDR7068112.1 uncharacterized membrane protein YoaK (UPF0700 family) [Pseudoxanthomonas japonensis]
MINRLPPWIWPGIWLLAFAAGATNVVGLISFQHEGLTHLTGNTSLLGIAIAQRSSASTIHYLLILASFVLGCAGTGLIMRDDELTLGWQEAAALGLSAALLTIAPLLLEAGHVSGLYLAAGACGLQNSIVTGYSGSVVRTTHVSGMFTDLGIFLGRSLRGVPANRRRLIMSSTVISGFLLGGVVCALVIDRLEYRALWIPAGIAAGLALPCLITEFRTKPTPDSGA